MSMNCLLSRPLFVAGVVGVGVVGVGSVWIHLLILHLLHIYTLQVTDRTMFNIVYVFMNWLLSGPIGQSEAPIVFHTCIHRDHMVHNVTSTQYFLHYTIQY